MGVFDEVVIRCPCCGAERVEQSKNDLTSPGRRFSVFEAPLGALSDVLGEYLCDDCGRKFTVGVAATVVSN